ncbi:xanthine dehydrogenase YagR molybdenum-binding subunit [Rhodopseudomonas thermotolerans]|uniref:Xanthine dehydrogenase YagR molybdenum-binding subunit n=2 Tax=Rhodopseudomonas TaxID=1073 RepID=A0A336JSN3_9BRAD|nr:MULTISPECIES: xanthine dehydrogenase family protein molybdopterin-binding subunit [Rhodopseudomonas]RED33230.1 xanthine dehydrogenase YagR molybdenum-binding subunit [Rhodopseudomonas pentothenatexigens]REF93979.1 xanthine dehydrogenase YagR molybdenum-binding subunit [Rhodopseudomonas thermotolerans]SSW91306.1 xanthine dehydrogenase YagR molybdenum-binding subunit [Rhodopseudomonas pentothenatexigens]
MTRSLTMDKPDERNRLDAMRQGVIGKPLDRPDGPAKTTGTATYAAEYKVDGCVEGVIVTATISKGEVVEIDEASVTSMAGVIAVISDARMVARPAQGGAGKSPVRDVRKVEYWGQPIAVVIAETFEQARDAAKHLQVKYRAEEGAVVDQHSADAPVEPQDATVQGDLDHAMREAAHTVDVTYTTECHNSAPMEPHASIAQWNGDTLTLHSSLQMLKYNVKELADALGLPPDKVRLISPYVGGGFGSKLGISVEGVAAAVAAIELKRPVRVVLLRQQVFQSMMRRSETTQRLRLAADREGRLIGFGHEVRVSNLPGESFAEPVTQASEFLYAGHNRLLRVDLARIHLMTAGSVRAPGEAVGMQALEAAMDELADAAGIDPVGLRLRNIPERHPSQDIPYSSRKLAECLKQGAERFGWKAGERKPRQRRDGEWWIGTGVASAARVHNLNEAQARVTLRADGTAEVASDMTDIGTGSYTVLGQIAAEMLGLDPALVEVRLGDSTFPPGAGSGGSWGAASTGSAVFEACEAIRLALADRLGCAEDQLVLKDGFAETGNRRVAFSELLDGEPIDQLGHFKAGKIADAFSAAMYGAFFAEVAVNAYTGETRVRRFHGTFGLGRVLNAKTATSQCMGGMVWGIGSALTEEMVFDKRDGHLVNPDLAEYHIPVNLDVPHLDVVLLDERDPAGSPLQAKGVGELGICGAAGAICNAIHHACGVRVRSFPITPDKILAGLAEP